VSLRARWGRSAGARARGLYCAVRWLGALPASDEPAAPESSDAYLAGALFGLLVLVGAVVGSTSSPASGSGAPGRTPPGSSRSRNRTARRGCGSGVFVPVACLFIPFRIVRAARATLLRRAGMTADGALVNGWWAAWVGSLIASGVAGASGSGAFGLVDALLFTVAFGLWTRIVLQVADARRARPRAGRLPGARRPRGL
jgi:hypothetical protein